MAHAPSSKLEDWMRQGLSLHQTGRVAEAEPFYLRVLDKQPSHPAANHLLGLIRLQQGQPESAVALIARAVLTRRDDPQYHCNLGVALNAAGQYARAVASLDRAIELQPDYAEAFSNRGMAFKNLGRPAEAVASYRQAIALRPAEAGFHLNLGNALTDLGDLRAAESSYRKALELRPWYPAALAGLCLTLEALNRSDEAVSVAEQATAAGPRVAEYHRSLGRAYRAAGRLDDAVASYRRTLALDPRDAESFRLMSLLLRRAALDDDMHAMERLLQEGDLSDEQQAQLHFALGKGYDDLGDHLRSFDHFVRGNQVQRRYAPFSLEGALQEFAAIERLFADADALPRLATTDAAPIFIVGLPRSGKSSLEGMLGRHARVQKGGELPILANEVAAVWRQHGLAEPSASLDTVPPSELAAIGANYAREAATLAAPPLVLIDTMPLNFRHIGFIRLALPNARVLHCVRDPLEHCAAMFQKYFARRGFEFASDLGELAAYYRLYQRLMTHWHSVFPGFIRDVDMAALRQNPEAQMRQVLDFCGLDWDPACAAPYDPEPEIGAPIDVTPDMRSGRLEPYRNAMAGLLA